MQAYALVKLPTESHSVMVNEVTEHVGMILAQLAALDAASAGASAWQKTAIERIKPFANELAANTSAAIEIIQKHPDEIRSEAYRDYIEANNDQAYHLVTLISSFVEYGRAREKLDRLSRRLELDPKDTP
jgi:hypothetical protein